MLCLGIETSCDETALALVQDGKCLDSVLATQMDLHALFGGVVPELASREHYRFVGALYDELMRRTGLHLRDVDAIAVTRGPGLLGALLVGVAFAKGLALAGNKPLVGVNHLHAHLLVSGLETELPFPLLGLLISGGHTHIYRIESMHTLTLLGRTLDDAAGEACDKFAKMLGLSYPGGILLDKLAQRGTPDPSLFPRPYTHGNTLDFSFSGLKTSALTWLTAHPDLVAEGRACSEHPDQASNTFCDLCASYMLAVADTLRIKMRKAFQQETATSHKPRGILIAGGVAANTQVRAAMHELAEELSLPLILPSRTLCTDNAIMIAYVGEYFARMGLGHRLDVSAIPRGQHIPDDTIHLKTPLLSQ